MTLALALKSPFGHQPQGPAMLDPTSKLGRTVTHAFPMNGLTQVVGKAGYVRPSESTGIVTVGAGASYVKDGLRPGICLKTTGAAAGLSVGLFGLRFHRRVAVSFWMYWDAFANDDDVAFEYGTNFTNTDGFVFNPNSGVPASGLAVVGVGGTGATNNQYSFTRPTAAVWHHYAINYSRPGNTQPVQVWIDTIPVALTVIGTPASITGNFGNNNLYIFSRNNTSLFGAGRMQNLLIRAGHALTQAEIVEEYIRPWSMYKPASYAIQMGRQ